MSMASGCYTAEDRCGPPPLTICCGRSARNATCRTWAMVLLKMRVRARLSQSIEPDVKLKEEPRNEGFFRHFRISSSVLPGPRPPRPKSATVHSIHSVNGMLRSAQFGRGVRNADEDAG